MHCIDMRQCKAYKLRKNALKFQNVFPCSSCKYSDVPCILMLINSILYQIRKPFFRCQNETSGCKKLISIRNTRIYVLFQIGITGIELISANHIADETNI